MKLVLFYFHNTKWNPSQHLMSTKQERKNRNASSHRQRKSLHIKIVSLRKVLVKYKSTWDKQVFKKVRDERFHVCWICGKYIAEAQARCFAHLLAKGMYPQYRLHKENIALVCWPECHKCVDSIIIWNNKKVVQLLLDAWLDFYSIMDEVWR